ncbi:MAG: hypothetical protein AB7I79_21795 [Rhizobiaceae bacterium]
MMQAIQSVATASALPWRRWKSAPTMAQLVVVLSLPLMVFLNFRMRIRVEAEHFAVAFLPPALALSILATALAAAFGAAAAGSLPGGYASFADYFVKYFAKLMLISALLLIPEYFVGANSWVDIRTFDADATFGDRLLKTLSLTVPAFLVALVGSYWQVFRRVEPVIRRRRSADRVRRGWRLFVVLQVLHLMNLVFVVHVLLWERLPPWLNFRVG